MVATVMRGFSHSKISIIVHLNKHTENYIFGSFRYMFEYILVIPTIVINNTRQTKLTTHVFKRF